MALQIIFITKIGKFWKSDVQIVPYCRYLLLPKYQPKRGGDLGWGKLFRFKCGIKNYLQITNIDLVNVWSQFNCNIDMIWNQAQVYI